MCPKAYLRLPNLLLAIALMFHLALTVTPSTIPQRRRCHSRTSTSSTLTSTTRTTRTRTTTACSHSLLVFLSSVDIVSVFFMLTVPFQMLSRNEAFSTIWACGAVELVSRHNVAATTVLDMPSEQRL